MYNIILDTFEHGIVIVLCKNDMTLFTASFSLYEYIQVANMFTSLTKEKLLLNSTHEDIGDLCKFMLEYNILNIQVSVKNSFKYYKDNMLSKIT